jgi:recombination protein RecA
MPSRVVQEPVLSGKQGYERRRQLDMAVATIQRRYGPWAVVKGKSATTVGGAAIIPHIPTGFPALDQALSIGGLPKGRVCELLGPATSGKTTLALKFLAQAQAGGGQVGYVDQAQYFDPDYAHRCGLDLSHLLVGTTQDLREALAMTEALARSGSLTALVFESMDCFWTDRQAASHLAATLNRLPIPLARSGTILLVLHDSASGNSPALSALAHCATVRLQVAREHWLYRHRDVRGYNTRVEVLKNRLGPSGRTATITIGLNDTVRSNCL